MNDIYEKFNIKCKSVNHFDKYKNMEINNTGGDKERYFSIYEKYLHNYKEKKINLIEIGVLEGDGLILFSNYLPYANITGIDIDIYPFKNKLLHWKNIGALNNPPEVFEINSCIKDAVYNIFHEKKFDIIIDDGNHHPIAVINTFETMYPLLNINGIYFIEDITNYRFETLKEYFNKNDIKFVFEQSEMDTRYGIILIVK